MSLQDDLLNPPPGPPRPGRPTSQVHPKGWEPTVTEKGPRAEAVAGPFKNSPDHDTLLEESGLDPDSWHILGDVQVRRWQQTEDGPWLRYFKFTASCSQDDFDPDWEEAKRQVLKHKPRRPDPRPVSHALVVCLADWQAGKGEGGGSLALADRIKHLIDSITNAVKKGKPDALYLIGMGDMVERCHGNYPAQGRTTDLNHREQSRFVRRALKSLIQAVAPHAPRIVIGAVPGNHGEVRSGGKRVTEPWDNEDVAVFEQVHDIFRDAPAYEHVSFTLPDEDLTLTLDVAGTVVSFAHGHQFGRGGSVQQKAVNWWKGQAMGRHGPGDADVLVSGHYHHFQALSTHGRLWLQCPSLDGGSQWFTDQTGEYSLPGTLTFRVDSRGPHGLRLIESE